MSNKNAIAKLYEYCQNKNTTISISDLDFVYEMDNNGNFDCKCKLNGEVFEKNLSCKSKRAAKNEIAEYVYEELMKRDNKGGYLKETEDNRNAIAKLNEYFQDKNTKLNLSDLKFEFNTTKEGYFNCIVTIGDKEYNKNLSCKSKKAAKNEIAEYVYNSLIGDKESKNIFNEKVKELLFANKIYMNEITCNKQEITEGNDSGKYMLVIESERFKNENNKTGKIFVLEPDSLDQLNEKLYKYLILYGFTNKKEIKEEKNDDNLEDYFNSNKIPYSYEYKFYEVNKKYYEVKCTYYSLGIVIGKKTLTIEDKANEKEAKKK